MAEQNNKSTNQPFTTKYVKETKDQSKRRREAINAELQLLKQCLPVSESTRNRLSQLQVLSLACVYIRKTNYFAKLFGSIFDINKTTDVIQAKIAATSLAGDDVGYITNNPNACCLKQQSHDEIGDVKSRLSISEFAQSLPGFIVAFTEDGKLLYISDNVTHYLGHSAYDLMSQGDSIYDIIDNRDRKMIEMKLNAASANYDSNYKILITLFCRLTPIHTRKLSQSSIHKSRYLIRGYLIRGLPIKPDHYTRHAVFLGICMPLIMPNAKNIPLQTDTLTFQTVHDMYMNFLEIDTIADFHFNFNVGERIGESWYDYLHPDDIQMAAEKHKKLVSHSSNRDSDCCMVVRMMTSQGDIKWVNVVMFFRHNFPPKSKDPVIVCLNQFIHVSEVEEVKSIHSDYNYLESHDQNILGTFPDVSILTGRIESESGSSAEIISDQSTSSFQFSPTPSQHFKSPNGCYKRSSSEVSDLVFETTPPAINPYQNIEELKASLAHQQQITATTIKNNSLHFKNVDPQTVTNEIPKTYNLLQSHLFPTDQTQQLKTTSEQSSQLGGVIFKSVAPAVFPVNSSLSPQQVNGMDSQRLFHASLNTPAFHTELLKQGFRERRYSSSWMNSQRLNQPANITDVYLSPFKYKFSGMDYLDTPPPKFAKSRVNQDISGRSNEKNTLKIPSKQPVVRKSSKALENYKKNLARDKLDPNSSHKKLEQMDSWSDSMQEFIGDFLDNTFGDSTNFSSAKFIQLPAGDDKVFKNPNYQPMTERVTGNNIPATHIINNTVPTPSSHLEASQQTPVCNEQQPINGVPFQNHLTKDINRNIIQKSTTITALKSSQQKQPQQTEDNIFRFPIPPSNNTTWNQASGFVGKKPLGRAPAHKSLTRQGSSVKNADKLPELDVKLLEHFFDTIDYGVDKQPLFRTRSNSDSNLYLSGFQQ